MVTSFRQCVFLPVPEETTPKFLKSFTSYAWHCWLIFLSNNVTFKAMIFSFYLNQMASPLSMDSDCYKDKNKKHPDLKSVAF